MERERYWRMRAMYRIRLMHMRQILFVLPDGRRITEQDLRGAGAAVYVISRISGEGKGPEAGRRETIT